MEAEFQTGSDTMLCSEQRREQIHIKWSLVHKLWRSISSSGNSELHMMS